MGWRVELDMFSGRQNPQWQLSRGQAAEFESIVKSAQPASGRVALPALGYRGFVTQGADTSLRVYQGALLKDEPQGDAAQKVGTIETNLDHWLLESGKQLLEHAVYEAAREEIDRNK